MKTESSRRRVRWADQVPVERKKGSIGSIIFRKRPLFEIRTFIKDSDRDKKHINGGNAAATAATQQQESGEESDEDRKKRRKKEEEASLGEEKERRDFASFDAHEEMFGDDFEENPYVL
eukprot:14776647-Ditylum_brightwellii.AAC.1